MYAYVPIYAGKHLTVSYFWKDINYEEGRIVYFGSNPERECGIKITSVAESDNGKWT
jgi:hypothetical protein